MESVSSSAMLDLNDADTEDTEPPSVTDDTREGVPLIMEHGYDIAVRVDAPMKQLSTLETFVTYRVRCVCARWAAPRAVRRRYNHFKLLHKRLSLAHPWLAPPSLPPLHTARQQLDRYSASFVAIRTMALHAFLDRVSKHPIFTHSEDFRIFLTTPDDELDKVFKSESNAMNLWGLSSALYGTNDSKPINGARVKDPEWYSYAEYLSSLQQKLTTLCTLTTKLHKGTASLSTEMINMKRTCDAWSSQARGNTARAAAAIAAAAGAAAGPTRAPARHRAVLPLLASYTSAHVEKIRQRDTLHAAYVAGASATGDMHNKLEQASEALRSELADWLPKTRSELKTLLLELADRQLSQHKQASLSWEHALKLSNEANVAELFKTVSKTAVQNLSPSRCRSEMTPTETERDLDELNYSNSDSDERIDDRLNDSKNSTDWFKVKEEGIQGVESLSIHGVIEAQEKGELLCEVLDDSDKVKNDSVSLEQSLSDVVSDPLREFSEVDLRDL
ncbi:putative sorting nexin family member 30 [Operophtera brumata]|uniref:Putative sorting nexin family member 30 n=1 Tax=Operophtera brumata TaxID=104452 RepID=A0A0L7LP91_OPEBR|nr:putative sorting nexin family member 30 [Operophtera brumata]